MNFCKGTFSGLAAALLFALLNVTVRVATPDLPPAQILFARGISGLVLLTPFVFKSIPLLWSPKQFLIWIRFFAGTLAAFALFYNIQMNGAGFAALFSHMATLFVTFFSIVLFRESLSKTGWLGVTTIFIGIFLLYILRSSFDTSFNPVGIFIGLAGAFCGGVAMTALKQMADKFSSLFIVWGFCLFCGLIALFFFDAAWKCSGISHLLLLTSTSLLGLFGQILLTQSYSFLPAIIASLLGLSSILWSVIFESIYFQSFPDQFSLFAYAIIFVGLTILQISYSKTERQKIQEKIP